MPAPQHPQGNPKPYWQILAKASGHAEIRIYSEIGGPWWSDSVDAKTFVDELEALAVDTIDVRINSLGGAVFDGAAIFNALQRHPANVTTYVDGIAGSIASVVAMAGSRVVMAKNAMMMIHNPWHVMAGDAAEFRKTADLLDKLRDTIAGAYHDKSGQDLDEIRAAMEAETWYTADEAVEAGLADAVDEAEAQIAALAKFDPKSLKRFRHVPDQIAAAVRKDPPVRTADNADEGAGTGVDTIAPEAVDDKHTARVIDLLAM